MARRAKDVKPEEVRVPEAPKPSRRPRPKQGKPARSESMRPKDVVVGYMREYYGHS